MRDSNEEPVKARGSSPATGSSRRGDDIADVVERQVTRAFVDLAKVSGKIRKVQMREDLTERIRSLSTETDERPTHF